LRIEIRPIRRISWRMSGKRGAGELSTSALLGI